MGYLKAIKKCLDNYIVEEKQMYYNKMLNDIKVKYNIGKVIVEAQGWKYNSNYGNKLIKEWSKELIEKYGPYFSIENLKNMRTIYLKLDEDYKNSDFLNFDFFIPGTKFRLDAEFTSEGKKFVFEINTQNKACKIQHQFL